MTVLRILPVVLALAASLAAPPIALAQPAGVLRVSAIPDEAPTELQRKFKPLGDYLKKETGLDVQFIPVTDYAAVVEGLATNKLDLAWLGGFTYVQAKIRTNGGVVGHRDELHVEPGLLLQVVAERLELALQLGRCFVGDGRDAQHAGLLSECRGHPGDREGERRGAEEKAKGRHGAGFQLRWRKERRCGSRRRRRSAPG